MTFSNQLSQRLTVCYERLDCLGDNRSNNVPIKGCFLKSRAAHSMEQEMGKGILRAHGCCLQVFLVVVVCSNPYMMRRQRERMPGC